MTWPDELARWAEDLVSDERAIAVVNQRARDRERAREALQRALVYAPRLYERWGSGERNYDRFRAWMVMKARNLLIDEFRKLRGQLQLEGEDELLGQGDSDASEQARVLHEVMAELPEDVQRLLRMRIEGHTLEEIAAREGGSAGTIYRRLQQPLAQLRRRLLEVDEDLFREYVGGRRAEA